MVFTPVLSAHWDDADSFTIDGYTRHGGYTALPKALAMEPAVGLQRKAIEGWARFAAGFGILESAPDIDRAFAFGLFS